MKATVQTETLKRALDLCGNVAGNKPQDEESQKVRSCLIFTVKNGEMEVAANDRTFLTVVPLEATIEDAPDTTVVFAIEMFRLNKGLKAGASQETVFRYTEEDAKEGFVHVQYSPKRAPVPYGTFESGSFAEYQSILDRAENLHEWDVEDLVESLSFVKQFVLEDSKAKESHRVLDVREDIEERWSVQGWNGNCIGICYPDNAGGDIALKKDRVNKLVVFLSRSKSTGTVQARETSEFYIFVLDDGAVFAVKKTALKGKRFGSDPLSTDEPIHFKVSRNALQSALGVILSGMASGSGRARFMVEKGDTEITISAQTANNKKIYDYSMPAVHGDDDPTDEETEPLPLDTFEHFTECRSLMEILPSMSDVMDLWIRPAQYMKFIDKKGDHQRVVLVLGMSQQRWAT